MSNNQSREYLFWKKVKKTNDCWLWTGATARYGYGAIWNGVKMKPAHRVSWEMHNGEIPEGIYVLHKCDVPACINPGHLFLGTQKDNIADMISKGRKSKENYHLGEKNGRSKLKECEVWLIRKIHAAKIVSQTYISKMFKVSQWTISEIINNKRWRGASGRNS